MSCLDYVLCNDISDRLSNYPYHVSSYMSTNINEGPALEVLRHLIPYLGSCSLACVSFRK